MTAANTTDDLPARLIAACRRDALTWEDRHAIGQAIARIGGAPQATPGADADPAIHMGLRAGLECIRDTFKLGMEQGHKTRDKVFALAIAEQALSAAPAAVAGPSDAVKFPDQSTADPVEKARRYLKAMGDQGTNSAYFFEDGYPKRESAQGALATLAVLEWLAATPTTPPAPAAVAEPSGPILRLNGFQLRDALAFIAPDGTDDQLATEACIQRGPARTDGEDSDPAGMFCWYSDYPEEGSMRLGESAADCFATAPAAVAQDMTDADMDRLITLLAQHDRDEIGHQGLVDAIVREFGHTTQPAPQPAATAAYALPPGWVAIPLEPTENEWNYAQGAFLDMSWDAVTCLAARIQELISVTRDRWAAAVAAPATQAKEGTEP